MRVWQGGGRTFADVSEERVQDWSWQRTARRVRVLTRLVSPYRSRAALAIFSLLAATLSGLAPPLLAKYAIDQGIAKGNARILVEIVAIFAAAGLINWVTSYAQTYFTGWVGERVLADLRRTLFKHLQRLPLGFYERNRTGVIVSRMTNDIEALDELVTDGFTTLVQASLTLTGSAALLFVLDWRLALATLTVVPAMLVATAIFRVYSARAYLAVRERIGHVSGTLAEDIGGMRVVQAYTRERERERNFARVNEHYREANQQTVIYNGLYFPFVDALSGAASVIVLGYGGWLVFHGQTTIGTLVAFFGYLSNFFDPIQQLSQLFSTFISATAALDKIMGVLETEPDIVDAPAAAELTQVRGRVHFQDVRFRYRDDLPEVMHGLELDVPAGTTVALVGHTGAGKSTIAKLLARFYDPTAGRITLDGVDLKDLKQRSLRSKLGIVPQEGFLFAGTVRDNIAFARPDASEEEIEAAARAVGALEFIHGLEQGFETQLGERGARLSVGQRQLIAFARALLADPRILILDEATSSVDISTERTIEQALSVLLADRTAFVIAHRLSTIRSADLIVVLEHGRVVEQGKHDELLARRGFYTSLYTDPVVAAS
ncbi:MAG: ABC transporter ATP-binding protein [Gaiellaceae bacterium]